MEPLVSVLIPAFNTEEFVADAINSALAQTWRRIEVIVVDDGSTDRTAAVCRQIASPALSVVSQEHQGVSSARNKALSLCQGDYIQWLDADDLLAPEKIAQQLESLVDTGDGRTLLSCAWAYFRFRPHRAEFIPTGLWADLSPGEWLLRKLEQNIFMAHSTWLVSRELTDAAGPWDTRLLVDNDGEYFCRVLLACDAVRFVPDAKVFYRRRVGSLSSMSVSKERIESRFLSVQMHIGYLRSIDDSDRARAACFKYLQRFFAYVYPAPREIIDQAQRLAASLGGRLVAPQLSWKSRWIQGLFGWPSAKRAQLLYDRYKSTLLALWDKSLARLENRTWTR